MLGVNWTVLAVLVIGLFALTGFLRGWWKEAVMTVFLAVLVFLWLMPNVARLFIDVLNLVIGLVWKVLPQFMLDFLTSLFGGSPSVTSGQSTPQIDPSNGQTWLIMLIVFIGLAILLSRAGLPNWARQANAYRGYLVTWTSRFLGAVLGILNGWLIISLVRIYLTESNLPGQAQSAAGVMAAPANSLAVQAVNVPTASILDSFLPWLFAGIGLLVLFAAFNSRVGIREQQGFRRIEYKSPLGYEKSKIISGG